MREPASLSTRAQLSLPALEAALAVVLVVAVLGAFAFDVTEPGTTRIQLDVLADDAATLLADEPTPDGGGSLLEVATRSPESFERHRGTLVNRTRDLLPGTVAFRVETPHGAVGYGLPSGVPLGRAVGTTRWGRVVVWTWYA